MQKDTAELAENWTKEQAKFTEFSALQTEQKVHQNQQEYIKNTLETLQKELANIAIAQQEQDAWKDLPQKKQQADNKNIQLEREKLQFSQKEKLQKSLKIIQDDIISCTEKLSTLEEDLKKLSPKTVAENQETALKKEAEYVARLAELTLETTQLIDAGKKLKAEYEAFTDLGEESECPTCKRPLQEQFPIVMEMFESQLSEKRNLLKEKTAEKERIQTLQKENTEILQTLKQETEEIQRLQKEQEKYQYTLKNHQEKLQEITTALSELDAVVYDANSHAQFQKEYELLLKDWGIYQKRSLQIEKKPILETELQKALQSQKEISEKQSNVETSLQKLAFDAHYYEKISQEYAQVSEKIQIIQQAIDAKKDEKITIDTLLARLGQEYEVFQKDQEHIREMQQSLLTTSQVQECLQAYITYLLHALKPHIETVASEYFSLMTDGLYSQISLDEDYHILIDGKTIDMYS